MPGSEGSVHVCEAASGAEDCRIIELISSCSLSPCFSHFLISYHHFVKSFSNWLVLDLKSNKATFQICKANMFICAYT